MDEYNIEIKLKAKNSTEASKVKNAFDTMVKNFQAEGIIKLEKIFKTDAFVRNLVKMKVNNKR
ncbi:MAG: hypothetical protein WBA74_07405 [Cyclobacteriaceae bacterium]